MGVGVVPQSCAVTVFGDLVGVAQPGDSAAWSIPHRPILGPSTLLVLHPEPIAFRSSSSCLVLSAAVLIGYLMGLATLILSDWAGTLRLRFCWSCRFIVQGRGGRRSLSTMAPYLPRTQT